MSETPSPPSVPNPRWQCWECQRRRLVCDSARPICNKCKTSGITCPGYDDKKPLTWLAPGRVVARNRQRKPNATTKDPKKDSRKKKSLTVRPAPLPATPSSPPKIIFVSSLQTKRLRTDLCDAIEAADFYTNHIYPRMMDTLLVPESAMIPLMDFNLALLSPLTIHTIVCLSLGYRIHNISRQADMELLRHLWSRLYLHRGAAIRILNQDIAREDTRASDTTISGLVVFLVQEIQQSIDPNWKYHFEGAMELTKIRGGLVALCRQTAWLRSIVTLLLMVGVMGNTTTPASNQLSPTLHLEMIDAISEVFESGKVAPSLCPKELFLLLIKINSLRFRAVTTDLPRRASRPVVDAILREIDAFSPSEWAATKEMYHKEWSLLAALFRSTTALYCTADSRYKSFKVTALLPFCGVLFVAGFAARIYGAYNYSDVDAYVASIVLIYMSPPLLELSNYHILGRVLYYVPHLSPTHLGRVLTTFGMLSAIVEVLNAIGVMYITNPNVRDKAKDVGHIMMQVGLVLQLLVISAYYVLAGLFHYRCKRGNVQSKNVYGILLTLYVSSSLILTRTIYRAVEHFGFEDAIKKASDGGRMTLNPILKYEWFFYVFEAMLMLVNMVMWNARHPGRYIPSDHRIYLSKDGITETQGESPWGEKPWYIHVIMGMIDPFGCIELVAKRSHKPWEKENNDDGVKQPTLV
ncbi:hypothetical protein jhhlp_000319 [Lomentospora prolificans]|uniref:Zn(2)-C6 fungal-type domain-containing protein n=1 Tax=Lomentospora prolificans TaxID=41688 RepID=A0A2N3NKP5_9PEZI|nr:hypothetical protein jhhlp_000319 [Lomentospora prolificans]